MGFSASSLKTLSVAVVLACSACKNGGPSRTATVQRGDIVQRVTLSGTVVPNRKTVIVPPYSGYVRKIFVQIGETITSGKPVISVTQSLARGEDSYPIIAPFSGTVVRVMTAEGEYVEHGANPRGPGGEGLVRIDDMSQMFVESDIPELYISRLKVGQGALLRPIASKGRTYKGEVQTIALAARDLGTGSDRSNAEFPVRLKILDPDKSLTSGMSVVIEIVTQRFDKVLLLKHEFVSQASDQFFALSSENKKIPIKIGGQDEDSVEIVEGLTEGQIVRSFRRR
jgi:multidrug efflux pump subunit AcrA (membrane-fusion protein)